MLVCLVVKVIDKHQEILTGYVREIDIQFVPSVGMKFRQGSSTWLWETKNGELAPEVKEVTYNIDDEIVYCLFEVNERLESSFWKEIKDVYSSHELRQFAR
ncbi:hypothetical protein [Paenibacillus sp. 1-18]|uniref:hypothetical protein n=1 Tax=Paenibacillus sp. 1-18 TaxID=1333846 RepID=UPI0004714D6E|nr:hypothetical protein [Paenibacillus sp. 1-18]